MSTTTEKTKKGAAAAAPATESTALAMTDPSALAHADILGGMNFDVTGLEETDASDFRLASILQNFGGLVNKEQVPKKAWFNTVTEEVKPEHELVLLVLHKSRAWTEFVQGEGTKRRCTSWDGVTGTMESGAERPCQGCPDAQWRMEGGKRTRRCGEVHNIVAADRRSNDLVMLRAKKTSIDPWKTFLNKFFLGKRVVEGKRSHVPLFAYVTKLGGEMQESNGNSFGVPVFDVLKNDKGEPIVLPHDELRFYAETARGVKELYLDRVREVADKVDSADGADGAIDASFEYGANAAKGDPFADAGRSQPANPSHQD